MNGKVYICAPSSRAVNPYTFNSFTYNIYELVKAGYDIGEPKSFEEYPLSRARNASIEDFYDNSDCDIYFSYDDDTVFKKGDLLRLVESTKEYPIVSGWYLARVTGRVPVVFMRSEKKKLLNERDFNYYRPVTLRELLFTLKVDEEHSKVDAVGLGAVAMTREAVGKLLEVSQSIGKPLFAEWSPIMPSDVHCFGEDLWFGDFCAVAEMPIHVRTTCFLGHFNGSGYVVGFRHLSSIAMREGLTEIDFNKA